MSFNNLQIDTDALPHAADIQWKTLDPRYPLAEGVSTLLVFGVIVAVATTLLALSGQWQDNTLRVLAIGTTVTLAATAFNWLAARARRYAVREHDIAHHTGLLWRTTAIMVFDRIQHIELSNGPLDRAFGLATLKFYTAGGATADLKIAGLSQPDAERLRRYLLERDEINADAG